MARNGSGIYSLPSGNPVVDGTDIEASWANATLADIANEITGSLPRNGSAAMSANLGMGTYKILNLGDGTLSTDAVNKGQLDAGIASATAAGEAAAAAEVADHVAAADPHTQYAKEADIGTAAAVDTGSAVGEVTLNSPLTAMGALAIDCSLGTYFTKTIAGDSTFTVSNVPASTAYGFVLELTHTSGNITWFSGVVWPNGVTPTLTTGKVHLLMFFTDDGGTTWRGSALNNYAS